MARVSDQTDEAVIIHLGRKEKKSKEKENVPLAFATPSPTHPLLNQDRNKVHHILGHRNPRPKHHASTQTRVPYSKRKDAHPR